MTRASVIIQWDLEKFTVTPALAKILRDAYLIESCPTCAMRANRMVYHPSGLDVSISYALVIAEIVIEWIYLYARVPLPERRLKTFTTIINAARKP